MDTPLLPPDAPPDQPIHRLTFEAWVDACWTANRYRDAYIEDFGLEDARYAAVSAGGTLQDARDRYHRQLFEQPHDTRLALSIYDELPRDLQTLALEHFASLVDDLQWRDAVEQTIASGCKLWARRATLRSIARPQPVILYRSASEADFPAGSSASLPFRREGGAHNARASGRVIGRDGQTWLEARYPGSACTDADRFLIAAPYAVVAPGGRPERPAHSAVEALFVHDFFEVDERPHSVYYVTARQQAGGSALLLGPFATHLEALAQTAIASAYVEQKARTSPHIAVSIGTGRLDRDLAPVPQGRLNAALLEGEELARIALLLGAQPLAPSAASA